MKSKTTHCIPICPRCAACNRCCCFSSKARLIRGPDMIFQEMRERSTRRTTLSRPRQRRATAGEAPGTTRETWSQRKDPGLSTLQEEREQITNPSLTPPLVPGGVRRKSGVLRTGMRTCQRPRSSQPPVWSPCHSPRRMSPSLQDRGLIWQCCWGRLPRPLRPQAP